MENTNNKEVKIYSTPTCHYCAMAKLFLDDNKIKYENYDVSVDVEKRKEMIEKTGQIGVPVIEIDGELMIGFDQERMIKLLEL